MVDAYRNADSLGVYLTGAGSDGGSQPDPGHSLGEYRSSTEAASLGALVSDPIPPIVIERVLPAIGEGDGYLRGDTSGRIYFTPPGESQSEPIEIEDGQTRLFESLDANKALRIRRDGPGNLTGSSMLIFQQQLEFIEHTNSVFAGPDLTNAERLAGANKYRAFMFRGHGIYGVLNIRLWIATLGTQRVSDVDQLGAAGAGTIETSGSFADWPAVGFCQIRDNAGDLREIVYYSERTDTVLTVSSADHRELLGTSASAGAADDTVDAVPGIRIALEAPDGDGKIQAIADEDTAPIGLSWSTAISEASGLWIPSLTVGANYGVWIHRQFPAGGETSAATRNELNVTFYGAEQAD